MIAFFTALILAVRENESRICVCYDACPKLCDVFEKILYYYTPDLDAEFTKLKTKYMDVRFCHAPNGFKFNIGTFDDVQVEFDSFHLAPKAPILVEVTRSSTAEPSFNNLDVTFVGYSTSQPLEIKSIKLKDVDSRNKNLAPQLITQSFEASNSVYDFTDINIKKDCSDPALSIDILKGYKLDLVLGKNIITLGASTFHFEGKASAIISTALENVKLSVKGIATEDIPYLMLIGFPYTTFEGVYPDDYIIQMQNLKENTVVALEKRLPISLDGAPVDVYVSQPTTTIEGDSSCDVRLHTKAQPAFRYNVTIVKLNGKIDIYSSWLDVVLNVFNPSLSVWASPFTFCVGKGGASTIFVKNTLYTGTSPVSAFKYHCDFKSYLDDESLKNLLKKSISVLYFDTNKTVFTTDTVTIVPADNLDVPGFSPVSNCVSVSLKTLNPFDLSLTAVSPTTLPLKLCYANELSECQIDVDGFLINDYSLSSLSDNCIYPGFKDVVITLKKNLDIINFGTLKDSQTDLNIEIKSSSSKSYNINLIQNLKPKNVATFKLTRVNLVSGTIDVPSVTFKGCSYAGTGNETLNFTTATKVVADDVFLQTLASHCGAISDLSLNLVDYDKVSIDADTFRFDNTKTKIDQGQIPASTVTTFTIYVSDVMTLDASRIPKKFKIVQEFTKLVHANQFFIKNLQTSTGDSTFEFDHGDFDVEIVRQSQIKSEAMTLIGNGEVTYVNRYTDESKICIGETSTCVGYQQQDIVQTGQFNAWLKQMQHKTVIAELYTNVLLDHVAFKLNAVTLKKGSNMKDTPKVTINLDVAYGESDCEYTTTELDGVQVEYQGGSKDIVFGSFYMTNVESVTQFQQGVKAINYKGTYASVAKMTTLAINRTLELYGNASDDSPKKGITVTDTNVQKRLRLHIPTKATVNIGDNTIKVNAFEFTVNHNTNGLYDVVLSADQNTEFTLTPTGSVLANFPKVQCNLIRLATVTFSGAWPATSAGQTIIDFTHTQFNLNLNLNCEHIPASFQSIQMGFNIVCNVANPKIYGSFNVMSEKFHEMKIQSGKDTPNAELSFLNGIGVDYRTWIKLANQVRLIISEISLTNLEHGTGSVSFQHYVSLTANSFVTVQQPLKNIVYYSTFEVYGDINKPLDDSEVQAFLGKTTNFLQLHQNDVSKFKIETIEFVDPRPTTHGFIGSNFEVGIGNDGTVSFKNKVNPVTTPVEVCFGANLTCEVPLTEATIPELISKLPTNVKSINFVFSESNKAVISLKDAKLANTSVTFSSSTSNVVDVRVLIPAGHVAALSATNINFVEVTEFSVAQAIFTNSNINNPNGIVSLIYDYDSWKRTQLESFPNQFQLVYPQHDITFNADGWTIEGEYKILAANFPKFEINFTTNDYVYLKVDKELTAVKNCVIYTNLQNIEVGKRWNLITSPSEIDLRSSLPLSEVVVTAQCYPFSVLPLVNGTTVKFDKETLPINVSEQISLNNQQFTIDFDLVEDKETSRLYLDSGISLSGSSKIYFSNSHNTSFPCVAKELVVQDGSESSASDIKVTSRLAIYGKSTLYSAVDVTDATVEFHWWGSHLPTLVANIEQVPAGVTVFFDGEGAEAGSVKDKQIPLANLGLNCDKWLTNVKFDSKSKQFRGKKAKTQLTCEAGVLTLSGSNSIIALSAGAIAGIVIGVVAFVGIIVGIVLYFVLCKRREGSTKTTSLLSIGA